MKGSKNCTTCVDRTRNRPLTEYQREVLRLYASGKSLKEISGIRGVSHKCIMAMMHDLREKLRVTSSIALAHYAIAQGITPLQEPPAELRRLFLAAAA